MKKESKKNEDKDEVAEGVSYEKGREFEVAFASFLKEKLAWEKVRVGAHLSGHDNMKGANIDIIGERLDEKGIHYKKISYTWRMSSFVFILLGIIFAIDKIGGHGFWLVEIALCSFGASLVFELLREFNHKQNCWVECKNLKSKVDINHVSKMIREIEDYKKSKNKSHKFSHYYFASASGYVENALKLATDHNIICYAKKGDTFEEVKYWS